jgi:hypothetical protein
MTTAVPVSQPPDQVKIAIDVDLIDHREEFVRTIVISNKMAQDNWHQLIGPTNTARSFEQAVSRYQCDICGCHSSPSRSIYTNNEYSGADVCVSCMRTAFHFGLQPEAGWKPGPVYSLQKIHDANFCDKDD